VIDAVVEHFRLGRSLAPAVRVPGGLSNELWRVVTESGRYAVKRMVASVDRPDFVANIEASSQIERRACAGGVPMPRPIAEPVSGGALARVGESLVRVHEWVDPTPGDISVLEVMGLLGRIHAVGGPRLDERRSGVWESHRWGQEITVLAARVAARTPARLLAVDSHRDLDRKNVLRSEHDVLALDWDAAGPVPMVQEVVAVALDWGAPIRSLSGLRLMPIGRLLASSCPPSRGCSGPGWPGRASGSITTLTTASTPSSGGTRSRPRAIASAAWPPRSMNCSTLCGHEAHSGSTGNGSMSSGPLFLTLLTAELTA
jgi:hypothetical protein